MIVMVAGLPGSGKSYFAEKFAGRLGAEYINSDRVRHEMDALGKYSFDDKLVVYREMMQRALRAIQSGKPVVVDATFYRHTMREMFLQLAAAHNSPIQVIEVTADEALVKARLNAARKYSEADFDVYKKIRDEFEAITTPHLTLRSTNDNIADMLSKAIAYIGYGVK